MLPTIALMLLVSVHPEGCCASIDPSCEYAQSGGNGCWHKLARECDYYKRVYYGHYDRQPLDYRFQFDYPTAAGPSRAYWPISPLSTAGGACWNEVEYEARQSPRVSIAARPSDGAATAATSLRLRK